MHFEKIKHSRRAYFPRSYITDFFKFIDENSDRLQVITYDDLLWPDENNFSDNYRDEYNAWHQAVRDGRLDARKAYVLLQYDVDTRPDRTMALLDAPEHQNVPANVMIFNRRVDRAKLKTTGELGFTEYPLDDELLRRLQDKGFVIGYHTNAMEQGEFDVETALDRFDQDVRELRKRFDIRYFSAHGGVAGANGLRNNNLPFHTGWQSELRWVHNGHTARFKQTFSDGGHNSLKLKPADRDLRDFVSGFKPGYRYRILLHPQYYDTTTTRSKTYGGTAWYDELLAAARDRNTRSLWDKVELFN